MGELKRPVDGRANVSHDNAHDFWRSAGGTSTYFTEKCRISRPIRRTVIFSLGILEKNNDECILILVIYWKKTGWLHTKISNHNIIYSS